MIKKGWKHCMLGKLHDPEFQEEAARAVIERNLFRGQDDCLPSIAMENVEDQVTFADIADPEEDMGMEGTYLTFCFNCVHSWLS